MRDRHEVRPYTIPFSSEVNMTNCYHRCKRFFRRHETIHFNQLIVYWMMGGYLGLDDSAGEAYQKGLDILYDMIYEYEDGVLKVSDGDDKI